MKIVIDIPDGCYEELNNGQFPIQDAYRLVAWIKNGTPQPEKRTETHSCDCISRQAVLDLFAKNCDAVRPYHEVWQAVEKLPSVEPERKKGHWIKHYDKIFPEESTIECSECYHHQDTTIDSSFCPNCGADMRRVQNGK